MDIFFTTGLNKENGLLLRAGQIGEDNMDDTKHSLQDIWDTLSSVNVNDSVERKNGFTYLSWAWAWGTLMQNFPDSKFSFDHFENGNECFSFPDGSAEVRCVLTVGGYSRKMWLPVMDHRNNAIKNPDARAVNDAKMRCLVKAMALFGLGHYIYAGEDLPQTAAAPEKKPVQQGNDALEKLLATITGAKDLDTLKSAFTKATRYAKNRNDSALVAQISAVKDMRKKELAK